MLQALLIPISWLYALGVAFRHWLYDHHLLLAFSVDMPTICVGNLAVGGTGKTPLTANIVQLLLERGFKPAILSRGYKRATRGFVLANEQSTAATIGDESMQLHRRFAEVPIAVCESRVMGVKMLKKAVPDIDVIVLDDAMQHRSIRCGFTILLTAYDRLYIDDHMLPWGRLRDLPSRALKADAVVVTKCPDNMRPIDMRVVDNRLHLPTFQQLHFAGIQYAPLTHKGTPLVLTGIADSHYMFEHVLKQYPQAHLLEFPDHHAYRSADLDRIVEEAKSYDFVLTTEKDMQRLDTTDLAARLKAKGKELVTLPIRTKFFTPQANFDKQILTYVQENCRK